MTVDATNVLTGAPDQLTTGPILSAPRGTTLPTAVTGALDPAFDDSGYISADGLNLTPERSTESIRDWSGAEVRKILTEFAATLAWSHLETNEASLKNYFGDDNVTVEAATQTEGNRLTALLRGSELPRKSWVFKIKDGDNRVLIVVPDGQITETGEVAFVKSSAITWPCTLTTYPDADGVHVYVYLDDGQVLTA
ncbi:major tail protein [Arthrobacter phage Renna12]|nr:major tail protein [Arthrobacter phage Renna12]